MPWCPSCGTEYREGIKTCYHCDGQPLTDTPPQPEKQKDHRTDWERYFDQNQEDQPAFLQTVTSDLDAEFIESLLRSYGIPVLRKYKLTGGYLKVTMGATNLGVDLYVPASVLQTAQDILRAPHERITPEMIENMSPEENEEAPDASYDAQSVRRITWRIFVWMLTVAVVILLLAQYISKFRI